ncbi:hypothetical protein PPYR_13181 [Photinus pyralis]|uniref:Pre-C2HC domain-containing protein n=1 Tax=Photinus pyralis TaxID=7054 RepID=A0A1Y1NBA4_PHOPY|nr:uncharacterized protein LOC116179170 [Photinus pyralis]KAB0793561.1 hypothetical protein PPYR_13181 [Photinus pyralis]
MSSRNDPWAIRQLSSVSSIDSSTGTTEIDHSSSSSSFSVHSRGTKSTSDLPIRNRKFNHRDCSKRSNKLRSEHYYEIKPRSGGGNPRQPFVCSLYVTTHDLVKGNARLDLGLESLISKTRKIVTGQIRLQKTLCGLTISFSKESDVESVLKLPLQDIFRGPVQVARFITGEYRYRSRVLIKDVPWCIPKAELEKALRKQGIRTSKVIRTKTHVTVEVRNALEMQRLIDEGLNFFNCTSFSAIPEKYTNQGESDIIQCFKCQGFWHTSTHCRYGPRCVRCGENHSVETCPHPRSTPICCHCGGSHHAAYKLCPVRLRLANLTSVGFQLSKGNSYRNHLF